MIAIEYNEVEIVKFLLSNKNIDVNEKSYWNVSYSYKNSPRRGINYFKSEGDGTEEKAALYEAIRSKNEIIVQLLLDNPSIDVNIESNIIDDIEDISEFILFTSSNIDDDHFNNDLSFDSETRKPLDAAINYPNENILMRLLSHPNIDISSYKNLLFTKAVELGSIEMINYLISNKRIDLKSNLKNSLQIAVENGYSEVFNLLLNLPEINVNDNSDGTALEIAVRKGNMEFFNILLNHPEININENSKGKTALKEAINYNNQEALIILLNRPEIDVNDNSGNKTALKIAIENENIEIVKLLLNRPEINVNDKSNGKSALKIAAENKNIEIVELLIARPEIEIDLENIYDDIDSDKLKIILLLANAKNKK